MTTTKLSEPKTIVAGLLIASTCIGCWSERNIKDSRKPGRGNNCLLT